jgi:hypothetical protein
LQIENKLRLWQSSNCFPISFGKESQLARLFVEELDISFHQYLFFLQTYFTSCKYRIMSVRQLHELSNKILLMLLKEYNGIWTMIADIYQDNLLQ